MNERVFPATFEYAMNPALSAFRSRRKPPILGSFAVHPSLTSAFSMLAVRFVGVAGGCTVVGPVFMTSKPAAWGPFSQTPTLYWPATSCALWIEIFDQTQVAGILGNQY